MSPRRSDEPGAAIRVAQLVTNLANGGAQATVLDSADMAAHGVAVTVLAGGEGRAAGSTLWADPRLDAADVVEVPRLVRAVSPIDDLAALWWLIRWLRRHRPDVLHTHSSKAGVVGRLAAAVAGIPCVHTVHGWGPLYSRRRVVALAKAIERLLARLSAALIVVGTGDLRHGLDLGIGRVEQYRMIRSGVDISTGAAAANDRQAIRAELLSNTGSGRAVADSRTDSPFVIGMVARMAVQKDHLTLIEAFRLANLDDAVLVLIGDGPTRATVEQAIVAAELEGRVHLLGSRPDGARLVAGFDVAVLSSHWEGMPRSVVEAAAASVPVVACEVGTVGDLIEDGVTGRVVPPSDAQALAAALTESRQRRQEHRQMAEAALGRVDDFSADKMRRDLVELWFELAAVERPTPIGASPHHRGSQRAKQPQRLRGSRLLRRTSGTPSGRT